jgi:rubrerythrin
MPLLKTEPFATVESMEELFAIASAMEQEAVAGYFELAERMRREGRPEMAAVFDRLVAEERAHLGSVERWSERMTGKEPDPSAVRWTRDPIFDDEGAATIAPELLSAYRAFSIAVRNEERAFDFWTYVAANSPLPELREAAEQMAREELEHVATLRGERRRAFHAQRSAGAEGDDWTLEALEARVAALLEAAARDQVGAGEAALFDRFALEARQRAEALAAAPLGDTPLLKHVRPEAAARLRSAGELLLDCYLDLGTRLGTQADRDRAQICAAQVLDCVSATRTTAGEAAAAP